MWSVASKTKGAKVHVSDDEFWALWEEITEVDRNRIVMLLNKKQPSDLSLSDDIELNREVDVVQVTIASHAKEMVKTGCTIFNALGIVI